jgi:hypothetical protein
MRCACQGWNSGLKPWDPWDLPKTWDLLGPWDLLRAQVLLVRKRMSELEAALQAEQKARGAMAQVWMNGWRRGGTG